MVSGNSDASIHESMMELLGQLWAAKPEDRSEKARRYAVTITEMEKVFAYFYTFVVAYIETGDK